MRKKIMACLLVAALALGQVLCVSANPSPGKELDVTQDSAEDGYDVEIQETPTPDEFIDMMPDDVKEQIKDKTPITPVFVITGGDTVEKVPSVKDPDKLVHRVELFVPGLTEEMLPDLPLHFYWGDEWHVIYPVDVDYENQTVTYEFDELTDEMLMMIFAEMIAAGEATGDSPKTGVQSNWMMWIGAAVVLGGVALLMSRKKRV